MYLRTHKGWDKLKMIVQLLYPSSALKIFPPHFSLRDVVLERIEDCRRSAHRCALLFFHVKQYGELKAAYPPHVIMHVEETIGHVLAAVVRRCVADELLLVLQRYDHDNYFLLLRDSQHVFRLGGLEEKLDQMRQQAEQELRAKTAAFLDIEITFSTAYVWLDESKLDVAEALRQALRDAQMLIHQPVAVNVNSYRADIRRILDEEDIHVVAQRIVSLSTGDVHGWEILTRGTKGTPYEQPQHLFHLAHVAGLLTPLELLVFQKALAEVEKKNITSPIFINVTVPSLCSRFFYQQVMQLMARYSRVCPRQIVLEITERHPVDDYPSLLRSLAAFQEAGFRIAVDDTGAGYSSLHLISELRPDFIKVDRSIINGIDQHDVKDSVLQALLLIAERIGCEVVAEGIETEAEVAVLLRKNVAYGQGFFYARPQHPFQ